MPKDKVMRIVTKHNSSKVTVTNIVVSCTNAPSWSGVELNILGSDSDPDDMEAYVWLNKAEVKKLAKHLLKVVTSEEIYAT